ncbi:MAG: hypothetical protein ACTSRH_03790 [Promethearchaeota archaeon]
MGRTPDVSIKIRNSGLVIKRFKDLFMKNLNLFLEGDYLRFIEKFKVIKGMTDDKINEINQDIQGKFTHIYDLNQSLFLRRIIVLSSLISKIRDISFSDTVNEIINRVKNYSNSSSNEDILFRLEELFMNNDEDVSMLYGISCLDYLAESFNFRKVNRICRIQKSKYINRVVNRIIKSNNHD